MIDRIATQGASGDAEKQRSSVQGRANMIDDLRLIADWYRSNRQPAKAAEVDAEIAALQRVL